MTDSTEGIDGRIWNSPLRKKLAKRTSDAISSINHTVPKDKLKSPSEKRSERFRKKLRMRAGVKEEPPIYPSDCRDCTTDPCPVYHRLELCSKHSVVAVCPRCGQKRQVRLVEGVPWTECMDCREKDRLKEKMP